MTTDSSTLVRAVYVPTSADLSIKSTSWANLQPVDIKHYWTGELAPATRHAQARLCWNFHELSVRFDCEQHEPLVTSEKPVKDKKTIGLWDRDVCEIFIAPDRKNTNVYYEFEAAPTGEWIDLGLRVTPDGRQTDWEFASGMKTESVVSANRIRVLIRIPWSERIPKPKVGDEWGVNLFRCVGSDETTRYMAWRPTRTTEPNFHVPSAFGILQFA